jgi:predicted RNA-binding Zn ribbon-like protein
VTVLVAPLPLPILLRLINGWGTAPRRAAGESDAPYPDLELLADHLADAPGLDHHGAVDAADRLHEVFAAPSGDRRAERLNALVRTTGLRSRLVAHDWAIHEEWATSRPELQLLAAGALSLLELLADQPDSSRLGTCSGDDCVDAYVDRSPGGRRRYCSLTCQNRARTRHYRARG